MSNSTTAPLDYYKLLGVSYQATPDEIKHAYRAAMKRSHPDTLAPEQRVSAAERARELNEAYKVLSRAESKQRYDQHLKTTILQAEIMNRYAGGIGAAGQDQDMYARIRDAQRIEQQRQRRQSDRDATTSIMMVFVVFALIVLLLLILGSVLWAGFERLT